MHLAVGEEIRFGVRDRVQGRLDTVNGNREPEERS